ncbi:MAG: DOMON-like domain-containing protein [Xanthobacteraceae bacterium]|jgi:hypothetical protein
MRQALKLYPDSHCDGVTAIAVDVAWLRTGVLLLSYELTGDIDELRLPPIVAPTRADELWRHTCFEAFIRPGSNPAYFEFNFAPSTQWAAYEFDGYRSGMRAAEIAAPRIDTLIAPARLSLHATLELRALPPGPWRLGLSAVIEEANGRLSYWALAHPAGRPDFHHADCFTCEF